jgi:AbrB family looped-hinge helix DNA binding protein
MRSKPMTTVVQQKNQIVVPDSVRRRARLKAGDEVEFRATPGIITIISKPPVADDEYTPEQRQIIDARLAKADKDIKAGRVHGPFTAKEASAYIERLAKERTGAKQSKKPKRPLR